MEENAKTELELSEEQLQEITGGCALCRADQDQVIKHLTIAKGYTTIAGAATAKGKDTTLYDNLRRGHVTAAINLLDRIIARDH